MIATANDFWRIAGQSQLFSPEECRQLEETFYRRPDAVGDAGAKAAAQWLVSNGMLTRFQAQTLLSGRPGPLVIGDYRVQDRIAEGRLAGMLRAVDGPTGHPVLLYRLAESLTSDPQKLAATKRQVQVAAQLQHVNLARVYELVESDGKHFVVTESLDGQPVPRMLPRGLPVGKACRIAHSVASALATVHQTGQAHSSVAPWNVWVEKNGGVKLLHFPLARKLPPGAGGDEQSAAAADYLAPEMGKQGARPTPTGDLYALGCVLYQLLSGQPPFAGGTVAEKVVRHASAAPAALPGNLPKQLAAIVARMLAKSAQERPANGQQVAQLLAPFAEGEAAESANKGANTSAAFEARIADKVNRPATQKSVPMVKPVAASAGVGTDSIAPPTVQPIPFASVPAMSVNVVPVAPPLGVPMATPVGDIVAPSDNAFNFGVAPDFGGSRASLKRRGRRNRTPSAVVAVVSAVLLLGAIAVLGAFYNSDAGKKIIGELTGKPASQPTASQSADPSSARQKEAPAPATDNQAAAVPAASNNNATVDPVVAEIADDGKTLWASPTAGEPIDLRYLPPGGQAFVVLRPADLLAHAEGEKVLSALGPGGQWAKAELEAAIGVPLNQIEQLIVGLYPQGMSPPQIALVARLKEPVEVDKPLAAWKGASAASEAGKQYFKGEEQAWYIPAAQQGKVIAMMRSADVRDVLSADGPPPLRREMERLLKSADSQRQFHLLIAPSVLLASGKGMFVGDLERLRDPVERFLGPNIQAASLSLHLGDAFYGELRVLGSLDQDGYQLARRYQQQVAQLPGDVVSYLATVPSPHAQRIFLQIPLMLSVLSDYLRIGQDSNQAVLNCYLPVTAAHNLIMGTELALATKPGGTLTPAVASNNNGGPKKPASAAEALQKKTSLSFDRNTLEQAMSLLAEDLGVKIVIIGGDLQLDGITKNQSFALDEREKTADEILRTVLKKANKDNKLVYVIKPEQAGGPEAVFITTRAAAEKRRDKLPEGFAAAAPEKKK